MSAALRAATVDDAELVAELFRDSFTETFGHLYTEANLRAFLSGMTPDAFAAEIADPAYAFRIATLDARPVGFAKLGPANLPIETPPGTIELRQIYVLESATGSGIGAMLMDWVLSESREGGAQHLQLSVYVDNHRARRFYERRGFEEVGDYRFMVGNHADHDVVMRRAL